MKAYMTLTLKDVAESKSETEEMQHCAERIWNNITQYVTRYVTVDRDAVFRDPDWPHLWDRK